MGFQEKPSLCSANAYGHRWWVYVFLHIRGCNVFVPATDVKCRIAWNIAWNKTSDRTSGWVCKYRQIWFDVLLHRKLPTHLQWWWGYIDSHRHNTNARQNDCCWPISDTIWNRSCYWRPYIHCRGLWRGNQRKSNRHSSWNARTSVANGIAFGRSFYKGVRNESIY